MVTGVSKGYEKALDISGVGFKAALVNKTNLMFTLGFSHPVVFPLPKGITATVDAKQTLVLIKGIDKQLVGQMAANIRSLKTPEPYKGKGIKYSTEVIATPIHTHSPPDMLHGPSSSPLLPSYSSPPGL